MKVSSFLFIPLLAMVACGGGSADSTPQPAAHSDAATAAKLGDEEIIRLVYDPEYRVPDGFFVDERADTSRSYSLHHVLDESNSYELCSDDYQAAVNLEAADNASRAVQGVFVAATETPRYWEFTRELAYTDDIGNLTEPTSPGFARVFKCNNTERSGVDRGLMDGYAGIINARPVNTRTVRDFTEYLWQFRFFPAGKPVVLSSIGRAHPTSIEQTLELASRRSQGPGECDLIEITAWRFSVSTTTGDVSKRYEQLRSISARLESGIPILCN